MFATRPYRRTAKDRRKPLARCGAMKGALRKRLAPVELRLHRGHDQIDTACLITTSANRLMSQVHDRMPAIVARADFSRWLDNDGVEAAEAMALARPAAEDGLELVEVGPLVNKTAYDGPELQAPLGEAIRAAAP